MPAARLRRTITRFGSALALVLITAFPGVTAPGDLDATFDGDGTVTTDFASGKDLANAVALQADGRIVVAGLVTEGNDFALARYDTDGSLDTTFDGDGKVTTDFDSIIDRAQAVVLQQDGKIVAAGTALVSASGTYEFALARYNSDGSLDTTFGGDGKVTTRIAMDNSINAVVIQGDGRIVAAGTVQGSAPANFALARYNVDGSLDSSFGLGGRVTTDFAGASDSGEAVALQADGRIVVAGAAAGLFDFALARYDTNGSLDTTFDGDGKVTTDFAGSDEARSLVIQEDQTIVAAGCSRCLSFEGDFALARYRSDGTLDDTFDGDGRVSTDFQSEGDLANGVIIQEDGRIVTAGCTSSVAGTAFGLARYKTDGSLDVIFGGGDGRVSTNFVTPDACSQAIAIQGDGKIVAAGYAGAPGENYTFAVARYTVCRRTSRPGSTPFCP